MSRIARLIVCLAIISALLRVPPVCANPTPSMHVEIRRLLHRGPWEIYRLHVESPGAPVILLAPASVRVAELSVNGVVTRAGPDALIGQWPFGHDAAAFRLANLHAADRIELRMRGRPGPPHILADLDAADTAFRSGLGTGAFYGLLIAIAFFQIMAIFALRSETMFWYAGYIAAVAGMESARNGFFPVSQSFVGTFFLAFNVAVAVCLLGFTTTYLRLYTDARRLFWVVLGTNILMSAMPVVVGTFTHRPDDIVTVFSFSLIGAFVSIVVAVMRRRAGYLPATYFVFGLLGIVSFLGAKVFRDVAGTPSPFLDFWGPEIGSAFDILVFALGIAYRTRFVLRHHRLVEDALREANHAATHDPLTTLFNRRGLDEWVERAGPGMRTVLFLDIDGFKAVNDLGGHAAGDETLSIVARIIRHAVRDEDTVARIGGDEFVAILDVEPNAPIVADIVTRISSAVTFLRPLGADKELHIGVSIGVGRLIGDRSFVDALREADIDAYRVKAEHHATTRGTRAAHKEQRLGVSPR